MGKFIDLTNQRFGFWQVINQQNKNKCGKTQWLCQCECGIQKIITSNSLRTGNSTSCGCNHSPNLIGKRFGNLFVIGPDYSKGRKYWMCQCDCGKNIITATYKLRDNLVTSCGCNLLSKKYKLITEEYNRHINYFNTIEELYKIPIIKSITEKQYFYRLSILLDINVSNLSVHIICKLMGEFHNGYSYKHIGNLNSNLTNKIDQWNLKKCPIIFEELKIPYFEDKWKKITHQNITPLAKILNPWGGIDTNPDLVQTLILKVQHS